VTPAPPVVTAAARECATDVLPAGGGGVISLEDVVDPRNPEPLYCNFRKIGEGASGRVYVATSTGATRKLYAIKKMVVKKQARPSVLVNEVQLMEKCDNHPCIVGFHASFLSKGVLWVVMDYVDGEDLTAVLEASLLDGEMGLIIREVARALAHLHSRGVVHRDIKSDNVMVSIRTGEVKLTDFGFGAQMTRERRERHTMVGTSYWMAPEVIRSEPYDYMVDIWSLGVLCMELVEREPPYFRYPPMKALFLILKHGLPPLQRPCTPGLADIIQQCTRMDPRQRPTAQKLLGHPFLDPGTVASYSDLVPHVRYARDLKAMT